MAENRGELAIVLHTHMPYVEGFGTWPFGEVWLWEAWADSYARLLPVLEGRPVTLGLTPVLCDQFEAMKGAAGDRLLEWLRDMRQRDIAGDVEGFSQIDHADAVTQLRRQSAEFFDAADAFETRYGRDIMGALRALGESGVELATSAYTHAITPLLATGFGHDLQVSQAVAAHERRFGEWAGGFWLPECAWRPGADDQLAPRGVRWFCTDQTPAWGVGELDHLEPVRQPSGAVALPIDWETIDLVWGESGFPSWGPYRASHRRTFNNLRPWRVDGDYYDPDAARAQAAGHASLLVKRVIHRLDRYAKLRGRPGLLTLALDTELLGHWWYEGPWFLESLFDHAGQAGLKLSTVSDALTRIEPVSRALAAGSWGAGKDMHTWDSPTVADLAWRARAAELELFDRLDGPADELDHAAALRAARELLALQSSDWAFKITHEKAGDYPRQRFAAHLADFERASSVLPQSSGPIPRHPVDERLACLAPDLDFPTLHRYRCGL